MKITEAEVRKIATLARLQLTETETSNLQHDLDGILDLFGKLNEADVTGIDPMSQVLFDADETMTLRADTPRPPLGTELALANAPQPGAGYFKIPKVIER